MKNHPTEAVTRRANWDPSPCSSNNFCQTMWVERTSANESKKLPSTTKGKPSHK